MNLYMATEFNTARHHNEIDIQPLLLFQMIHEVVEKNETFVQQNFTILLIYYPAYFIDWLVIVKTY